MRIIIRKDGKTVSKVDLKETPLRIGQLPDNEIVLEGEEIQPFHAKIYLKEQLIFIEDQETPSGTIVRGQKIKRAEIAPGEKVLIGPYQLFVEPLPSEDHSLISQITFLEKKQTPLNFEEAISVQPKPEVAPPLEEPPPVSSPQKPKDPEPAHEKDSTVHLKASEAETTFREFSPPEKPSSPQEEKARLVWLDGEKSGSEILLDKEEMVLGRGSASDVLIPDRKIAKKQASILKEENSFILRNEDRSTGTFVDGVPVRKRELENHDIVQIGKARLEFVKGTSRSKAELAFTQKRKTQSFLSILQENRTLVMGGFLGGLVIGYFLLRPTQPPPPPNLLPETPTASPNVEELQVARYFFSQAEQFVRENKLTEAEERLKVILENYIPNDPDAKKLLNQVKELQAQQKQKEEKIKKEGEEINQKVSSLLSQAEEFVEKKQISQARKIYEEVLTLERKRIAFLSEQKNLSVLEEQERRAKVAEGKKQESFHKIYLEGIKEFEKGNLPEAEKMLRQVSQNAETLLSRPASLLLSHIQGLRAKKTKDEIQKAKKLLANRRPLEAFQALQNLKRQFPSDKQIPPLIRQAEQGMLEKARDLYQKGLMEQKLAENPALALDRFNEVLRYVPDPKNEYHQKAKKKIQELQLSGGGR